MDIPLQSFLHNEHNTNRDVPLQDSSPPPPDYTKSREVHHNHYHIGNEAGPVPWYRRKQVLWASMGFTAFILVTGLIVLGVSLKMELGKKAGDSTSAAAASTASTDGPQATATPFTMSEKSQLASAYFKAQDSSLSRRLLVRQEDTNNLLVTEWQDGKTTHYRLKEKLGTFMTEAKPGTPLALQADDVGTLHLFYLSRENLIQYAYELTAGTWKSGEVSDQYGVLRTSATSGLSSAWHNGKKAAGLLVVAFDNPSQNLQLAVAGNPSERNSWYVTDVTSVFKSAAPGQSNVPCYSLAGDWYHENYEHKEEGGFQSLLVAVLERNEVVAWECNVDFWPPPDVQARCSRANDTKDGFHDGQDKGLTMVPPPKQFGWVNQMDPQFPSVGRWAFTMLSVDGSGRVHENSVGVGIAVKTEEGFTAAMPVKALSTTSEGMAFVSSGKDVFVYRKQGSRWEQDVDTATNATFRV